MKLVSNLAVAAVWLAVAGHAHAEKHVVEVTRSMPGLSVQVEQRRSGRLEFSVRREPAEAQVGDRVAILRIASARGLVAECAVEAALTAKGVKYAFVLDPDYVEHSRFVLSEIDTTGIDTTGIDSAKSDKLLGGGTYYHLPLKSFVEPTDPVKDKTIR